MLGLKIFVRVQTFFSINAYFRCTSGRTAHQSLGFANRSPAQPVSTGELGKLIWINFQLLEQSQ